MFALHLASYQVLVIACRHFDAEHHGLRLVQHQWQAVWQASST